MLNFKLVYVFLLCPLFLFAQNQDIPKREVSKGLSIFKIEQNSIILDSLDEKVIGQSREIQILNHEGFITNDSVFNNLGELIRWSKTKYLYDTLPVESYTYQKASATTSFSSSIYSYNKHNQAKRCSFYNDGNLVSKLKYFYNKKGAIKKIKQIWYADMTKGSYDGKGVRTFQYQSDGQLKRIISSKKLEGKKDKEKWDFQYDKKGNHLATYYSNGKGVENYLVERKAYDDQGRVSYKETFFTSTISINTGISWIRIPKGKGLSREFYYDINDLRKEERIHVDGKLKKIIQFNYFSLM